VTVYVSVCVCVALQMAKDPAYIRDALLVDDGGVNVPQHSSGSHFGGGSTRNKTIGRGMRSISSKVILP